MRRTNTSPTNIQGWCYIQRCWGRQ